ncbi:MAG: hypothetical protein CME64_10115 [Halobacteriovoraceae bacterium]|nr:hypothetical protein [Halobacteriovoraceae bacterium]|tara:strand:+ start:109319 stop:109852 length:534 start_codon:yes stop_codon:yes gene_type:complete
MQKVKRFIFSSNRTKNDELIKRFKKEYLDNEAFVRSSIYWMVNSNSVDDLVQETFLKAWRGFDGFQDNSSFKTWIYRIAMNVVYTHFQKNSRVYETLEGVEQSDSGSDPEISDLISLGLMKLTPDQRQVFSLHYQLGFTYREVGELLEISEGTAKSRANSAKTKFVSFLNENGFKYE